MTDLTPKQRAFLRFLEREHQAGRTVFWNTLPQADAPGVAGYALRTVRRLASEGLIACAATKPSRTPLAILPAGRDTLRRWAHDMIREATEVLQLLSP